MGNRTGVRTAERLELFRGESNDDFILGGNDLEQIRLVLLRPRGLSAGEDEYRQSTAFEPVASRQHAMSFMPDVAPDP
jgi:hypothetical protein